MPRARTVREYDPVTRSSRALGLLAVVAVVVAGIGVPMASAAPPSGKKIERTVRALMERYPLRSTLFGVWVNGRRLAGGALGESQPGVAATKADHFRIGNVTESFTTTLLLRLVDQGRVRLEDPLSTWFPNLPMQGRSPSECWPAAFRAIPTTSS